ncbi:MAG: hypothetical protein JO060_01760 [Candidatus Eremiobacteraeota bacterium]|nr:hypothetical protein [Candidatus Eremiobacteraeota bacterium]
MKGHIVLLTGGAPYLGGPRTWQPLRDAAADLEFRDLDPLDVSVRDDFSAAVKNAITSAADGAAAIVAHGAIAGAALEAIAKSRANTPVVLLSPIAVTKDSAFLRAFRAALNGPLGAFLTAAARSKRKKLLTDELSLRRQMERLVRSDKISDALFQEARGRLADPRMDAFVQRTPQILRALLTPSTAVAQFKGASFFGHSPMDRKVRKRVCGTLLEAAWSAPMLEAPESVANHLQQIQTFSM